MKKFLEKYLNFNINGNFFYLFGFHYLICKDISICLSIFFMHGKNWLYKKFFIKMCKKLISSYLFLKNV
jgi:hypothetical protein